MADFFDDEYGEEDNNYGIPVEPAREFIIFAVDASRSMQEAAGIEGVEGVEESDSFMDLALKAILETMKQHIVGAPKDEMAVLFYGARASKKPGKFPSVNIFQPLDQLTAKRIKQIEELVGSGFEAKVGSTDAFSGADLVGAMWATSQIFAEASRNARRRVLIFTNNPDPIGAGENTKHQILEKAKAMRESKIEVLLFNLTPAGSEFPMDFWRDVVHDSEAASELTPMRIEDLAAHVRYKSYRKRALGKLTFTFGPGAEAAVKLYALVMKATPSKSVNIHSKTSQVLKKETNFICGDTGKELEKRDVKYAMPKLGGDDKASQQQIILTAEEKEALKIQRPAGITLLGFKSMSCLKPWHQIRHSSFVYPDEQSRRGSTALLVALHDCLLRRDLFALCTVVRIKNAQPRHVAMIAQQEQIEESGLQITPPGFNLIWLPFADDIREPEGDENFVGPPPYPEATPEQLAAVGALLEKLTFHDFEPATIPNPHLQLHYKVLEAVALDEKELPEMRPEDDLTLPDDDRIEMVAGQELAAVQNAFFGEKTLAKPAAAAKKRKAAEAGDEPGTEEVKALVAADCLHKLTVPKLKDFCRRHDLPTGGRKDDLLLRITEHIQQPDNA